MKSLHIALASDNKYVEHACVVVSSVLANNTSGSHYKFHIVDDGSLLPENVARLKQLEGMNCSINLLTVEKSDFKHCPCSSYWPLHSFYRYALPDLLDEDKVLYLDCDVLIRSDISELWALELDSYWCAAVRDTPTGALRNRERIGFSVDTPYFNSGVILFNLKACRENTVSKKLLDTTEQITEIATVDQDVYNLVMKDHVLFLGREFNLMVDFGVLDRSIEPKIFHFAGSPKPWERYSYADFGPYGFEYFRYLKKVPGYSKKKFWEHKLKRLLCLHHIRSAKRFLLSNIKH